MEKMQWFKFSISEWKMGRVQKCNPQTRLAFLELCCMYWLNETKLTIEDAILECDEEHYKVLVSKKIIKEDGDFIKIFFLDEQFEDILEKSIKAKKSVEKRWAKRNAKDIRSYNDSNTVVFPLYNDSNTEEKRIEEKKKDENRIEEEETIKEKLEKKKRFIIKIEKMISEKNLDRDKVIEYMKPYIDSEIYEPDHEQRKKINEDLKRFML